MDNAQGAAELALGKEEITTSSYGEDQTLIEASQPRSRARWTPTWGFVNALVGNTDAEVYFGIIPEKSEIWADRFPARTPNDSEAELIEYCYGLSQAHNVDLLSPLREHSDEYIYYRTDHHWTSLRRLLRLHRRRRGHGA